MDATLRCAACATAAVHMVEAGFHPYYWTPTCPTHTPPGATTRPIEEADLAEAEEAA